LERRDQIKYAADERAMMETTSEKLNRSENQ
jgi:hypothetical protein